MNNYKVLTFLLLLGIVTISCNEEDKLQEYPGQLVEHGSTFINMPGTETNNIDMRVYAFSGSDENDLSSLPNEDWTYELWIKVDPDALIGDRNAESGLTAGGACIGERRNIFELYLIDDDDADYAIKYGKLQDQDDLQAASMQSNESEVNLSFNQWVHVAISRSASDGIAKFYINGILIDSSNDPVWIGTTSDGWLDFNYMYRGSSMNFFKGSMENIRLSIIDRYPEPFAIERFTEYVVDDNTLLQLNLNENLTSFDPPNSFDKIDIRGYYEYYIKVHNTNTWTSTEDIYYPLYD